MNERSPTILPRQTVSGAVTQALRERILHGDYADGEQLRQEALSKEFGVSRVPIREALRQLEAEGLIQIHDHRGAVVTKLDLADVQELLEIRALLEADLLARAIPLLTEADLARAEAVLVRYEQAFAARDIRHWGELNAEFHEALFAPANRPHTLALLRNLHHKTDRYTRAQLLLTGYCERAMAEHRELLELCRRRETEAACAFLREHIATASRSLGEYLARCGQGG